MATETAVDVVMPQMGVSVSEGTVTRWLKQEGEQVEADEPLLEISTDKVDTEVPSPASGTLTQILVQEGATVDVGTKLGQIGGAVKRPGRHGVRERAVGDVLVQLVGADDVQELEPPRRLDGPRREEPGRLQRQLGSALVEEAVVAAPTDIGVHGPGDVGDHVDLLLARQHPQPAPARAGDVGRCHVLA
jgi:pyruvate/2-oxoglutarate dehydrogenase complex dihydrolipoamide acyltransferase (E2) component